MIMAVTHLLTKRTLWVAGWWLVMGVMAAAATGQWTEVAATILNVICPRPVESVTDL